MPCAHAVPLPRCGCRAGFMQPPAQRSEQWRGGVRALRRLLRDACESDPSLAASFLNHLFSSASWAATEMVVAVEVGGVAGWGGGSGGACSVMWRGVGWVGGWGWGGVGGLTQKLHGQDTRQSEE